MNECYCIYYFIYIIKLIMEYNNCEDYDVDGTIIALTARTIYEEIKNEL